ncbi:MAG: cytochrome P450 [Alphaproteobacteria bacterium]|nr:cytochrome P450 [Alphaproteobacteria bacterium]
MADVSERAPDLDIDPYDDAFLADPYPGYAAMRRAGPAFYMPKYACWGMARYKEVRPALLDWKTYASGMGVGYTHFGKEKPWRPPSLLLETDPPLHDRTRRIVDRVVSPAGLQRLREPFAREAAAAVERVLARGRVDGVADLAEAFPLKVFPDAVGLDADGRENLLPYGDMVFNGFGPLNARFKASTAAAGTVVPWIMDKCSRAKLAPDALGAQIYGAVEAGEATEDEAAMLVRSFLSAGLDTTVAAIGSALYLLATNPGEWRKLRADPSLARNAFEETLRMESPLQNLFRTTTRQVELEGLRIPASEKVLLLLASANRDPEHWEAPDRFDITRRVQGHVGLGVGVHVCVGQVIARMEGEVLLAALAQRVASIDLAGPAVRGSNNAVRRFASLPLEVRAA